MTRISSNMVEGAFFYEIRWFDDGKTYLDLVCYERSVGDWLILSYLLISSDYAFDKLLEK